PAARRIRHTPPPAAGGAKGAAGGGRGPSPNPPPAAAAEGLIRLGEIPEPACPAVRRAVDAHPLFAFDRLAHFERQPGGGNLFLRGLGARVGEPFAAPRFVFFGEFFLPCFDC